MNRAIARLKEHGIKPSMQRVAIMQYMMSHRTHPSVEMIYNDLHPSMPTLSRTTVYSTLELLAEHGAVLELTLDKHTAHYDGDTSDHAHLLCNHCGKIYDMEISDQLKSLLHANEQYHIQTVKLSYIGTCPHCLPLAKQ